MTKLPNNKYRRESLSDWDIQCIRQKFSWIPSSIGLLLLGVVGLSLVLPFIPARYDLRHWVLPATLQDYQDSVISYLIIGPVFILVAFVFLFFRTKLDILLHFKWVGDFKIKKVIEFGRVNIILKNGWPLKTIRQNEEYFNSTTPGQIITIKRTATLKLISTYIRDYDKFITETNTEKPANKRG